MKDVKIQYREDGKTKEMSYDTIMDFLDAAGSMPDYEVPFCQFFENKFNMVYNTTITGLVKHCKKILK